MNQCFRIGPLNSFNNEILLLKIIQLIIIFLNLFFEYYGTTKYKHTNETTLLIDMIDMQ